MGIFFALLALFSWGFGDWLIQKSARRFGDWVLLFYLDIFAAVVFLPFVYRQLKALFLAPQDLFILLLASGLIILAGLLDFEALKRGKLSVIEPIYALEVPVTVILGTLILREFLSGREIFWVSLLVLGIFLVATKNWRHLGQTKLERGVWMALAATLTMGAVNLLFGIGSRQTSPLLVNWFTSTFSVAVVTIYLFSQSRLGEVVRRWKGNKKLISGVVALDNLAWLSYSYSTLFIPVAMAISISESYIALAAMLGLVLNKEKLKKHQWIGLVVILVSVTMLALVVDH